MRSHRGFLRATLLACSCALACEGSGGATGDATAEGTTSGGVDTSGGSSSGSSTTTSGPDCTPGTEGCACDEGTCEGELSCFSQICVMLPAESSSSDVETSTSSAETTESSSDESSSSSDESSSSTGPAVVECEEEGNHVCHDGILDVCTFDVVVSQSCDDICAETGYLSPGCADINSCACDGYADAACETIMTNFCHCYGMLGLPCDDGFENNVYEWCFDPTTDMYSHDVVVCFGAYPNLTFDECNVLYEMCF
ncbi:MAG TPA: hypothetical protein VG755_29730 [Nannocystaceae bacterium]|nr:hypothetical protein [Nannocystaceae bacterium]